MPLKIRGNEEKGFKVVKMTGKVGRPRELKKGIESKDMANQELKQIYDAQLNSNGGKRL